MFHKIKYLVPGTIYLRSKESLTEKICILGFLNIKTEGLNVKTNLNVSTFIKMMQQNQHFFPQIGRSITLTH